MQWHEAIFLEKPAHRLLRHSVFWVAWWIYFSVCQYLYQQPPPAAVRPFYVLVGSHVLLKTLLLIVIYAIACYTFIYFLLPKLIKGKWLIAIVSTFVLCIFLYAAAWFLYWQVFPFVDSIFGASKPNRLATKFWPAVSLGLIDPLKVVAAAGIIKYVKYWWLKQKESERLEREKINAELQLLKAQIHPGFLLQSLNHIYAYSLAASPRAPEMLLKLSDLLSYMLYECDQPLVPLEKEVDMMKDYMALEKIRLNNAIETELSVRGDMTGKMIAPFLLLPIIENSFKHSSISTEQAWINMDISMEEDTFLMKLANGIKADNNNLQAMPENGLENVQKRLHLIYPQYHELKITREREMLIVLLKIRFTGKTAAPSVKNEQALITEPTELQENFYAAP